MTLVVGQVQDDGISIVADTKITRASSEDYTRRVFANACPKAVILREHVAAGVAGEDPRGALEQLVGVRNEPVAHLLETMATIDGTSFVLASLEKDAQLWSVYDGSVEDRTSVGRAWAGDYNAYELFQQQYLQTPQQLDVGFRLMSSMQWLLNYSAAESVGGYLTRISTTVDGKFTFVSDRTNVGPDFLEGLITVESDGVDLMFEHSEEGGTLRAIPAPGRLSPPEGGSIYVASDDFHVTFRVPPGGDVGGFEIVPAVGRAPTLSALAYFIPQARMAWLFRHESPWEVVRVPANSFSEFIEVAEASHGQLLG